MKQWKWLILVSVVLCLIATSACAKKVPLEEYDKVKADLATAQTRLQSLQNDYNSAIADRDKAKNDLSQAKADSDKVKADLATTQTRLQSLQNDYNSAVAERDKARSDLSQIRTDYDKVKADLATAQARAQKLEGDLSLAQAQAKELQNELGSAKVNLDKTRADMQKLQALLATAQPYLKILDLFMDSYRQEVGIKPKYWQYGQAQMDAELTKAVEATRDPALKAFTSAATEGETKGDLFFPYFLIALNSIISGEGIPTAAPPAPPQVTPSPTGQTVLEVKLVTPDGKPVPNAEVGVWTAGSFSATPDVGVGTTNASGIVSFTVPAGDYWIDCNPDNFPPTFILPPGREVWVIQGTVTRVEFRVFSK